jgi:hypothetical protein
MAAFAVDDEHPTIGDLHIAEPQSEDLAATQPGQQHRLDHRSVPPGAQRPHESVDLDRRQDLRQRARHPHQRHDARLHRTGSAARRQPAWHRVRRHRRVSTRDQIGVEARHGRQAAGDRSRRQTRLPINDPHHLAITALGGEELEHVRRRHRHRIPPHDAEERLQIERRRLQRVRPTPASNEVEIAIHERITERVTGLTQRRHRPNQTRE